MFDGLDTALHHTISLSFDLSCYESGSGVSAQEARFSQISGMNGVDW